MLIDAPICPLGIALFLCFQPLSMIVVVGHVCPCAMTRVPLDSGARDRILCGLSNLDVPPFVGWLFIAFAGSLGIRLVVLGGSLAASGILELLFESIHLGGQGNDLGVGRAGLTPAPICHTIAVEDAKLIDDGILVGHPPRDPGRFGKAHINGKELVGGGFCSAKKLVESLSSLQNSSPFSAFISC
jgi:hypothetical protein